MGLRGLRVGGILALVAGGALGAPAPLAGQAAVRAARLSVEVGASGAAEVRIVYELSGLGASETVAAVLLAPQGVSVTDLLVGGAAATLRRAAPLRWEATLAPVPSGATATLEVSYRVSAPDAGGGVDALVRVPLLVPSAPPAGPGDVFTARLRVPEGWRLLDGFPSGLRDTGGGLLETSLPVVPSTVTVRARTDGSWRPGLPFLAELLAAVVLVTFGLLSWRALPGRTR